MKNKEKFLHILRDDEIVLWIGGVNKKAYLKTVLRNLALLQFCFVFLPFLLLALTIFIPLTIKLINKSSNNIYLCVTDKQIIKRYGIFRIHYQRISLSSVTSIDLKSNIYDEKGPLYSYTLEISTKYLESIDEDFTSCISIDVYNLQNANEAYKIISKNVDNEALNVKIK